MNKSIVNKKINYSYTVTAVVFGADESILSLNLMDGFNFVKKSLIPGISHLDEIFDNTAMGLRRDYEDAIVDRNYLDVICVEKKILVEIDASKALFLFDRYMNEDLTSIDNQIRAIRFLNEGALRFKKISFKMTPILEKKENIVSPSSYSGICPISESYGFKDIEHINLNSDSINMTNNYLKKRIIPFDNDYFNIIHSYYDLSYHRENHISIVLLITALEMIFLQSEDYKKEKLSKRSSVYLYDDCEQIIENYEHMKKIYKKRCDFVHDGKYEDIVNEDILFLRKCVREIVLKLLEDNREKNERIKSIKEKVKVVWKDGVHEH